MKEAKNKCLAKIDRFFSISKRGGTFGREFLGGLVNFLVMSYIAILVPSLLSGMMGSELYNALFLGTILSVVTATLAMGIYGNLPIVLAPGLGVVTYLISLVQAGKYTYPQVLAISLIAGVIFIIVTVSGLRDKIIAGMPTIIKTSMGVGIGMFIASIGLNSDNSHILDFLSGNFSKEVILAAVVAIFGLFVMLILKHYKIRSNIFIGMLSAIVLDIIIKACMGVNAFAGLSQAWGSDFSTYGSNFFNFDFIGIFSGGAVHVFTTILVIFSFFLVDMFDTLGTLYSVCKQGNLYDEHGNMINVKRAMIVDSSSSVVAALFGLPTCTSFVESASGISSGAKTGLASIVTGLCFVLMLGLSPLLSLIPLYVTAPALIYVGMLMLSDVVNLDLSNFTNLATSMATIIIMPLTGNITYGIAAGMIIHTVLQIFAGKYKEVNVFTYIVTILFIIFFATQGLV